MLFLKSMTYTSLPLYTDFSYQLPTTFHGARFNRQFFGFIFIAFVVVFDTRGLFPPSWSTALSWIPGNPHSPGILLPPWSFLPMFLCWLCFYLPTNVSVLPWVLSSFSLPSSLEILIYLGGFQCHLLTLMTLKCTSLASDFFSEIQASIFIAYLSQI